MTDNPFQDLVNELKRQAKQLDELSLPTLLWARVTQASPLRIRLDGDEDPMLLTPDSTVAGLSVGERVVCVEQNRRIIIISRVGAGISKYMAHSDSTGRTYVSTDADGIGGTGATYLGLSPDGDTTNAFWVNRAGSQIFTIKEGGQIDTPWLPYSMASGSGSLNVPASAGANVAVTFPSGRFNVAPNIQVAMGPTGTYMGGRTESVYARSNTGFTFAVSNTTATAITVPFMWTATQMRSNAANG